MLASLEGLQALPTFRSRMLATAQVLTIVRSVDLTFLCLSSVFHLYLFAGLAIFESYQGETSLSLSWSSAGDGDCVFQNWQVALEEQNRSKHHDVPHGNGKMQGISEWTG